MAEHQNLKPKLATAGAGGQETAGCALFGDDIAEISRLVRGIVANFIALGRCDQPRDDEAVSPLLFEMCMMRAIDAALTYITSVLRIVYRQHSMAILRDSDTIELGFVLKYASRDELVEALIEDKVHGLSYRSLDDLDKYLKKTLKVALFGDDQIREQVVRVVDIRNLITHNRGLVNAIYKRRQPHSPEPIGTRIRMPRTTSTQQLVSLTDWIADLDLRLIEKFNLPTQTRVPRARIPDIPMPQVSE